MLRPVTMTTAFAALALLAAPALSQSVSAATTAQTQATTPAGQASLDAMLRAKGEEYHRAPDSEQNPAEVQATQSLNAEVAAGNQAAADLEAAQEAGYERAVAGNQADAAEIEAMNAKYEADLAAANAARAEYDRAYATWEGLIRACEASGRTDCRVNAPQ